ncbi:mariner Mos1 transposase [Trichonephila clavipes]|nr:mariner Mos1 transposase [Trichonephila clavipes]
MACALEFLDRYHKDGDQFLERIVTGDKTWVSHIIPESKRQSMKWRHTNSPVRVKAKRTISTRKVMATVFWDRHGVLLVEFMQQGTTINAAAYCATLIKLRRVIQNKRHGFLTSGVLLLQDNARPHSAINTQNLIRSFGWEHIDHPPYSPDLAPSDFHLFRYQKEFLGGKRFDTAEEVKEEVQDWLSSQAADIYDLGIQKLVERYDKCLKKHGKDIEKRLRDHFPLPVSEFTHSSHPPPLGLAGYHKCSPLPMSSKSRTLVLSVDRVAHLFIKVMCMYRVGAMGSRLAPERKRGKLTN